jgi:glutathione synthase
MIVSSKKKRLTSSAGINLGAIVTRTKGIATHITHIKGFFIKFDYTKKKFFKILNGQKLDLSRCKFILIRQDPPFNLEYISATYILDTIKDKVKIINNPTSIRNVSEKLYSVKYQKYMPSTIFTQNIDEIKNFFRMHKKVILKPIHSFSGNDIHLLNKFNLKLIQKFIKQHDHIMCQKYLPKISKGDKRVFLINGKVCGAISRVPKKGSFLSNMSKGAKPINIKLTKTENKISKLIAKDLKKENIYFAGIDFIDQKLNGDINVTSPTGLKTLFDLSGINLAKTFWEDLKA